MPPWIKIDIRCPCSEPMILRFINENVWVPTADGFVQAVVLDQCSNSPVARKLMRVRTSLAKLFDCLYCLPFFNGDRLFTRSV